MTATTTDPDGQELTLRDDVLEAHVAARDSLDPGPAIRLAFAATHVVMRESYRKLSHTLDAPGTAAEIADSIDWEATRALRVRLDSLGFGIAEAMDTAQRFFIGWETAKRLIEECGSLDLTHGFIAGAGVDHLDSVTSTRELIDGVVFQIAAIQAAGGQAIILPMPYLTANGLDESEYVEVYGAIIRESEGPLHVHWLGEMFLPALAGYFPGDSFRTVMALDPEKVRGAKLSLLDDALELELRRELRARDQILLTGDDFHFARLIRGGDPASSEPAGAAIDDWTRIGSHHTALGDFSHALLGIFDGIAKPAGLALELLARGDGQRFLDLMLPCEELGRWLFREPTRHYKAGLAFLSWLNGFQDNFMLVNREERARDRDHYLRAARLASDAGVIENAELAADRLTRFLSEGHD